MTANPITLELTDEGIYTRRWCFAINVQEYLAQLLCDPLFECDLASDRWKLIEVANWLESTVENLLAVNHVNPALTERNTWCIAEGLAYKFLEAVAEHRPTKEVTYFFSEHKSAEEIARDKELAKAELRAEGKM